MAILERHTAPSPAPTDEFVARGLVQRLPMFGLGVVVCLSIGHGFGTLVSILESTSPGLLRLQVFAPA